MTHITFSNAYIDKMKVSLRLLKLAIFMVLRVAPLARADNVVVLDSGAAELNLIDEPIRKVVTTVPAGKEPHHLMITPDGKTLIVANSVSDSQFFVLIAVSNSLQSIQHVNAPMTGAS